MCPPLDLICENFSLENDPPALKLERLLEINLPANEMETLCVGGDVIVSALFLSRQVSFKFDE